MVAIGHHRGLRTGRGGRASSLARSDVGKASACCFGSHRGSSTGPAPRAGGSRRRCARPCPRPAPEAVVHELTALPERFDPRKEDLHGPTNASAPRQPPTSSRPRGPPLSARARPSATSRARPGRAGPALRVALRPGHLLREAGTTAQDVRRRRFPVVGSGSGVFSFIHVDDAARATVAAVERGAPGVYNIVDDEPGPMREWLPAYARALGAKPPRRVPRWLARLIAGGARPR
jgi:hypothetical protein